MSKIGIVAILMIFIAPTFAVASQGGGTGGDSIGGGTYLSSQGGGTGGDSLYTEIYLRSQGGGTGGDSVVVDVGNYSSVSEPPTSTFAPIAYLREAFQQYADKFSCLTNLGCSQE